MEQPPEFFTHREYCGNVCQSKKSLNDLKSSPRAWLYHPYCLPGDIAVNSVIFSRGSLIEFTPSWTFFISMLQLGREC